MHFANFASLFAISASVVLASADGANPSVNLVRADNPTVSLPRSGFTERRAAMAALKPRAIQDQCNAATGFFQTTRCVLRRGKVVTGPAVSYATDTLNTLVTDIWRKIQNNNNDANTLTSADYAGGNLYVHATSGYPGSPATCTWSNVRSTVSSDDLWVAIWQAVLDAQTNGGINRYYLSDLAGNVLASVVIKTSAKP
ncbi:hypothetical protein F5Y04DRAFT_275330 [Hypomontagnella monticulosa]|nr:hypothetical protein F5Y04DRAFT_275330 [Hypomontagnella monticulosa]